MRRTTCPVPEQEVHGAAAAPARSPRRQARRPALPGLRSAPTSSSPAARYRPQPRKSRAAAVVGSLLVRPYPRGPPRGGSPPCRQLRLPAPAPAGARRPDRAAPGPGRACRPGRAARRRRRRVRRRAGADLDPPVVHAGADHRPDARRAAGGHRARLAPGGRVDGAVRGRRGGRGAVVRRRDLAATSARRSATSSASSSPPLPAATWPSAAPTARCCGRCPR